MHLCFVLLLNNPVNSYGQVGTCFNFYGTFTKDWDQMSSNAREPVFGSSDQVGHKPWSQKKVRILKFSVEVDEELYYPSCENKGADQLRSYWAFVFV